MSIPFFPVLERFLVTRQDDFVAFYANFARLFDTPQLDWLKESLPRIAKQTTTTITTDPTTSVTTTTISVVRYPALFFVTDWNQITFLGPINPMPDWVIGRRNILLWVEDQNWYCGEVPTALLLNQSNFAAGDLNGLPSTNPIEVSSLTGVQLVATADSTPIEACVSLMFYITKMPPPEAFVLGETPGAVRLGINGLPSPLTGDPALPADWVGDGNTDISNIVAYDALMQNGHVFPVMGGNPLGLDTRNVAVLKEAYVQWLEQFSSMRLFLLNRTTISLAKRVIGGREFELPVVLLLPYDPSNHNTFAYFFFQMDEHWCYITTYTSAGTLLYTNEQPSQPPLYFCNVGSPRAVAFAQLAKLELSSGIGPTAALARLNAMDAAILEGLI